MSIGNLHSVERGSGARFNAGKPAMELVPLLALEDCARVFDYGRKKYSEWNWAKGMAWSVPYACMLRHLAAWQRGETNDPESGLPHLGHVMCNLVMLTTYAQTFPEGDDRPMRWLITQLMPEVKPTIIPHSIAAAIQRDLTRDDDEGDEAEPARFPNPPCASCRD